MQLASGCWGVGPPPGGGGWWKGVGGQEGEGGGWGEPQLQLREPQRRTQGKEEQKREEMSYRRLIWGSSRRELSHQ